MTQRWFRLRIAENAYSSQSFGIARIMEVGSIERCAQLWYVIVILVRHATKSDKAQVRRPLILLGHSYGGLVIKQALVTATTAPRDHPRYNDYQALITAVSGVMFLGTPHSGSSFASVGIFQANFRSWFGSATNAEILKPLALDTTMTTLKDLEENFQTILSNDRLSALISLYFYETKPLTMGVSLDIFIVYVEY
jgi:pimeloyl-ACP methyl ester carboxylesterase